MNIYRFELKSNIPSTLLWIGALGVTAILVMCFYPMLKSDLDTYMELIENFPPVMKAAFDLSPEKFLTPLGLYTYAFTFISLFGAVQAMNLGVGILSKEEREKTADFLLTKPVTREKVLTAKVLASLTIFVVTNILFTALSAPAVAAFSESSFEAKKFALINLSLFFLQVIFFSIGLVISAAAKKIKAVLPVSLGFAFSFYAISAFAVTSEDDKLRFITPFQYFKSSYIASEGRYEPEYALTGLFIAVAGTVISYVLYKRRDIAAV